MPRWLVRWLNSIIVLKLLCRGWGVWVVVFHPKGSCTSQNIAFPLGDVYEALAHACYPPSPTVVVLGFLLRNASSPARRGCSRCGARQP